MNRPWFSTGPYHNSLEHLWDELQRMELLARAQTVRWRLTLAAHKLARLWGMLHVTKAEIAAFLQTPFTPPGQPPAKLAAQLQPYWQHAAECAASVRARCAQTPATIELRGQQLRQRIELSPLKYDLLLLCLLPELDERYRRLFGYLLDDATRTRPTVELVAQLLSSWAWRVFFMPQGTTELNPHRQAKLGTSFNAIALSSLERCGNRATQLIALHIWACDIAAVITTIENVTVNQRTRIAAANARHCQSCTRVRHTLHIHKAFFVIPLHRSTPCTQCIRPYCSFSVALPLRQLYAHKTQ